MRNSGFKVLTAFLVLCFFCLSCFSDTFTHRERGEVLHGYATSRTDGGKTVVHTEEKGEIKLNLIEWQVIADRLGRNNKVVVLTLDEEIAFEIETSAMEQAIAKVSDEGPLFILLEIDTPGGRDDLTYRICGALLQSWSCPVVAFIKGGRYGGALSAGVAVALACDKIYMASNTVIGAATMIAIDQTGPKDLKELYGEALGEKFSSAWQAKLASLAERKTRPGLLARAMVERDVEVIEVSEANNGRFFIDPVDKRPQQRMVRTWSKKGSLLTLTATEAVECGIADKIRESRAEVLGDLGAADAEIVINNDIQKARVELKRARGQLNRIRKDIDFKIKQSEHPQPMYKVLKILRSAKSEFKILIRLAGKYPDLGLDIRALEEELNSIEADYEKIKMGSRRR